MSALGPIKPPHLICLGLALAVTAWMASGVVTGEPPARDAEEATARQAPLPEVRVRTVTARERTRKVTLFGRTEADRTVELRAEAAARVDEQVHRKGDLVEAAAA